MQHLPNSRFGIPCCTRVSRQDSPEIFEGTVIHGTMKNTHVQGVNFEEMGAKMIGTICPPLWNLAIAMFLSEHLLGLRGALFRPRRRTGRRSQRADSLLRVGVSDVQVIQRCNILRQKFCTVGRSIGIYLHSRGFWGGIGKSSQHTECLG